MKIVCAVLLLCGLAGAQDSSPMSGKPWDLGVWVGGGFSVPGGTKDTQVMNVGVRLGKVLTGNSRVGNFEWSADVMPIYYVLQPFKQNAFGGAFNPLNLTWNLTREEHRLVPFAELGGGVLFTNKNVPIITNSTTNFLTHASFGVHLFTQEKRAFTLSAKYEHISNAGLATPNPGINTMQFTLGYHWFK
jgi:hypothetical protein